MKLINRNLKLSFSTERELEKLNEIFMEESKFFLKIEGETGPNPDVCFSEERMKIKYGKKNINNEIIKRKIWSL